MERASVLICGNAGSADRGLLNRYDFDLAWALTAEEVRAATRHLKPTVVIAREWLADAAFEAKRELRLRTMPILVLLAPETWPRQAEYWKRGATGILAVGNADRLFEALSELSGLSFARYPRVTFRNVVDVLVGGERMFLVTRDLSTSGLSLLQFPVGHPLGAKVRLVFEFLDPPLIAEALLVRYFREGVMSAAGLCFDNLSPESRVRIQALVAGETAKQPRAFNADSTNQPSDPRELPPLPEAPSAGLLVDVLRGIPVKDAPDWLLWEARHLTPIERASALGEPSPPWAQAALLARFHLARARARAGERNLTRDEFVHTFEVCNRLGRWGVGGRGEDLAQLTQIRGALLRKLYAPDYPPV